MLEELFYHLRDGSSLTLGFLESRCLAASEDHEICLESGSIDHAAKSHKIHLEVVFIGGREFQGKVFQPLLDQSIQTDRRVQVFWHHPRQQLRASYEKNQVLARKQVRLMKR